MSALTPADFGAPSGAPSGPAAVGGRRRRHTKVAGRRRAAKKGGDEAAPAAAAVDAATEEAKARRCPCRDGWPPQGPDAQGEEREEGRCRVQEAVQEADEAEEEDGVKIYNIF